MIYNVLYKFQFADEMDNEDESILICVEIYLCPSKQNSL